MPSLDDERSIENRLLSPAGIPKLRRIAKDRLRFKGKGHEVRCHSEASGRSTNIFGSIRMLLGC